MDEAKLRKYTELWNAQPLWLRAYGRLYWFIRIKVLRLGLPPL